MQTKEKIKNSTLKVVEEIRKNPKAHELYTIQEFMKILDKKLYEAKDMLIERFKYICNQPSSAAKFMYENNVMAGYNPEEGIRSALKHGTLALG